MTFTTTLARVLAPLLLWSGCGGAPAAPALAQPGGGSDAGARQKPAWKRTCEEYAGAPVEITYQDASGGAAVVYRTKGDVQRLRERTTEVARFHNAGRPRAPALHDLYHIPHNAYVENVEGGAKLVLVPKSADFQLLEELQRNVLQEVSIMRRQGCGRGQEAL